MVARRGKGRSLASLGVRFMQCLPALHDLNTDAVAALRLYRFAEVLPV